MNEEDKELERLKRRKMKEIISKEENQNLPDSPIHLTDSNFKEIINKYPFVVVDFWADWCSACKPMAPLIERMAKKYSDEVVFGKLNIDKNPMTTEKYQVSSIPTLLYVKQGNPVDKTIGMIPQQRLEQKLEKYLD